MTHEELERAALWNSLCHLGNYVKLKWQINSHEVEKQLAQFDDKWVRQNGLKDPTNNRWALPITSNSGSVDDTIHLGSFGHMKNALKVEMKESNFVTPTEVYHAIPELGKLVDLFDPDIGRVHLLRVDRGGFFPPHRDFQGTSPEYLRLLCVFGKCSPENYAQIVDGQLIYPESGWLYFANVQLDHSVFSFSDGLYCLILTVKLNQRTHDIIMSNTMNS